MIYISDSAQEHFVKLLVKREFGTQIRVFVTNPGTPYAESGVSYCSPHSMKETDTVFNFKRFAVYIDKLSAPYLRDAEIDLLTNHLGSQLTLKAPYAKVEQILPSHASLTDRVKYMLHLQINPQLASHGGYVDLIEITKDGYVVLKFSGGCNGCYMVSLTLKNGIEKQLLNKFPELKGVYDFTEHKHGVHSYY